MKPADLSAKEEKYYKESITKTTQLLAQDPLDDSSRLNRSIAFFLMGQFDESLADITKLLNSPSADPKVHLIKGAIEMASNKHSQAVISFSNYISHYPKDAEGYNSRGSAYYVLKDYPAALSDLSKAIDLDPKHGLMTLLLDAKACEEYRHGNYDAAIADLSQAIEYDPEDFELFYSRGTAYYLSGNYEKAVEDFTDFLEHHNGHPKTTYAHLFRGSAHLVRGYNTSACRDFTHVIEKRPDLYMAFLGRGICQTELGEYAKSIDDFTAVIASGMQQADGYFYRGKTYFHTGQLEQAKTDLNTAYSMGKQEAKDLLNRL